MKKRNVVGAAALAILWVGSAIAQVTNGDFTSGATGWTTVAPGSNDFITYTSNQLKATSNDNSSGNVFSYASQTFTASDPGFLSYKLTSYNSTDSGDWDHPETNIDSTTLRITTGGDLASTGTFVNNSNQVSSALTGAYGLTAGSHSIRFGVRSKDSIYGAGVAIWDDIDFQELTISPGAQTTTGTTPIIFSGVKKFAVATNTHETFLNVTISVSNGILTLNSVGGIQFLSGANNSSSMTFRGVEPAINTALNGLKYTANVGYSGSDMLNISTTTGGVTDPDTVPITVLGVSNSLNVTKSASHTVNVPAGQVVTYTFIVENTGDQPLSDIKLTDVHDGSGPAPVPGNETLHTDAGPQGDSSDAITNGVWDILAPDDRVEFTATYTVTQTDIDTKQ